MGKVKGHATDEMVGDGKVRLIDKEGNDQADKAAETGARLHGKILINIAGIFHFRCKRYLALVKAVHRHIIEGYAIHRALLERTGSDRPEAGNISLVPVV